MTTTPGAAKCEILISDSDQDLFSNTFFLYIEPNVVDGNTVESVDQFESLADSYRKIKDYEEESLKLKDKIEEIYDQYAEVISTSEPSGQLEGSFWLQNY